MPAVGDRVFLSREADFLPQNVGFYDFGALLRSASETGVNLSHRVYELADRNGTIMWAIGDLTVAGATQSDVLVLVVSIMDDSGEQLHGFYPVSRNELLYDVKRNDGDNDPGTAAPETDDCAQIAHDECGPEPDCAANGDPDGTHECVEAAQCRLDRCYWAQCFNQTYDNCGPVVVAGIVTGDHACVGFYMWEVGACLPSWLLN